MFAKFAVAIQVLALCGVASAAARVRLVYGKGWDRAGETVKATMSSPAFKTAARGKYVAEFVEETGDREQDNLGSLKLPAIFVLDAKGHCFCVIENVPSRVSAESLVRTISSVDRKREAIEAKGSDTADQCGELLLAMEKYVGGPKRVISEGFYADVFERLKRLDPSDDTGWQRHFTMGDGIDLVAKATEFREKGDMSGGERFIAAELKKPRHHLTREQQQALLMAQFALYREDASRREANLKLLTRIGEAGENTFWGTAAIGWLNILGAPPLSVYWGWRRGDFAPPRFSATVKYGVAKAFPRAGEYDIEFVPSDGGAVTVESVTLLAGDEEVATLKKPPFSVQIERAYAGKLTAMVVRGTTASDTGGRINVTRRVLRPRKTLK